MDQRLPKGSERLTVELFHLESEVGRGGVVSYERLRVCLLIESGHPVNLRSVKYHVRCAVAQGYVQRLSSSPKTGGLVRLLVKGRKFAKSRIG